MWHRELSVNLSEANDRLAKQLAVEVLRHTVVVVKDQKLTPQQELEFCEKIGKVQKLPSATQFAAMDPKKEQLEKIRATYAEEDEDGADNGPR